MNIPFGFGVADLGWVRQLHLERDQAAIKGLGRRCVDYLRPALGGRFGANDLPNRFLAMLHPRRVPPERSSVLGIYSRGNPAMDEVPRLTGVLRFLHPDTDPGTWYVPLLLLEPGARGQGLGSAMHAAFVRWAMMRGAQRLIVAVLAENVRAQRFWRDRLGYVETRSAAWGRPDAPRRRSPEYVRSLTPTVLRAPWTQPGRAQIASSPSPVSVPEAAAAGLTR